MKQLYIIFAIAFLLSPLLCFAQNEDPHMILEYYGDDYEIEITDEDGTPVDELYYGMELELGDTVTTYGTVAELRLDPNGSIIKLSSNTVFTVETLQGRQENVNGFALLQGKIRAVAARSEEGAYNYSIRTPSAVCGVRGTEFGQEVIPGERDAAACLSGEIEFISIETGETITITDGQAADVFGADFKPFTLPPGELEAMFNELQFEQVDPGDVPGYEGAEEEPEEPAEEIDEPEEPEETAEIPQVPEEPATPAEEQPSVLEPVFDFLGQFMGMEVGALSINGKTYGKAVIQPHFEIGKLRMAFYLPIIYNTNLLDPSDWYRPKGNNEWSFGTDHTGTWPVISDILTDLALKIRYVEFAEQRDPFFFKIGNLDNLTLGHGILMYNYANDHDFPAIRRIGFNLGLDLNAFGFESIVNDLAYPQIMGGRLYFRPAPKAFPMAIGLSSILDIKPSESLPVDEETGEQNLYGDPLFLNPAFDIDFPFIETDPFSMVLFADVAGMIPYYRESYSDPDTEETIQSGWATRALYDPNEEGEFFDKLNNYGFSTGIFGGLFFLDYRLEYRYADGIFRANFFNATYDRMRGEYVKNLANYLNNPDDPEYDRITMGIYGELGATIADKVYLEGGYLWPWAVVDGTVTTSDDDFFHLEIGIKPKVIPVLGLYGSITYSRTKFAPTLLGKGDLTLFDANTTLEAELVYPITDLIHLALMVTTNIAYNDQGEVIPNPDNPDLPQINPSVSFETRISF